MLALGCSNSNRISVPSRHRRRAALLQHTRGATAATALHLLAAAEKEWAGAEAADSKYQKLLADVRAAASVCDLELQLFRRTLRAALGRNDKDFQKLRGEKAGQPDEDDPPEVVV